MIIGVGIDIVEIERVDVRISSKVLTRSELLECEELSEKGRKEYLAGRFALKEAFFKALGTGLAGYSFKDVEFLKSAKGQPVLRVRRDFHASFNFAHVSLSHDKFAAAVVVLEKLKGGVFISKRLEIFEVLSEREEMFEIDTDLGPFELMKILEREDAQLIKYGNIWEVG